MSLTPYDTGERFEPKVWPLLRDDPESYGRVDFENDESVTELTIYVKRAENGDPVVCIEKHTSGHVQTMVVD